MLAVGVRECIIRRTPPGPGTGRVEEEEPLSGMRLEEKVIGFLEVKRIFVGSGNSRHSIASYFHD